MNLLDVARILEAAAREARAIAGENTNQRIDWITQAGSPLGPRRHISAVKKRVELGLKGAGIAGRKYLLSPAALAEELGQPRAIPSGTHEPDEVSDLRRSLALVRRSE